MNKKYKELFPELKDANTIDDYLKFIRVGKKTKIPGDVQMLRKEDLSDEDGDFYKFINKCLKKSGYTPGEREIKLIEVLLDILIYKGILTEKCHSYAADILIAAAVLHNTYTDESKPYTSIFKAREEFMEFESSDDYHLKKIPFEYLDLLFETIEKQNGENVKLKSLIPQSGSPIDLFATCVWLVDKTDYLK